MKRIVTIRHIRSIIDRKEKINIDDAIDRIKADRSHSKYTRNEIKKALRRGTLIQLDNHTLQIEGVGYDENPRTAKRREDAKEKKRRLKLYGYDYKKIKE